jgi:hypothetical protein
VSPGSGWSQTVRRILCREVLNGREGPDAKAKKKDPGAAVTSVDIG